MKALSKAKLRHSQRVEQHGDVADAKQEEYLDRSSNTPMLGDDQNIKNSIYEYERNLLLLHLLNQNLNLLNQNDQQWISKLKSDDIEQVNLLTRITDVHYIMDHVTKKISLDLGKFNLYQNNREKQVSHPLRSIVNDSNKPTQEKKEGTLLDLPEIPTDKSPTIKKPLPMTPSNQAMPPKIFTSEISSSDQVTSPTNDKRLKPLPKPALLDTKEVMYTTLMGSTKEIIEPLWKLDNYNELKTLSYEILLLTTHALVDVSANRENLDTILNVVRKYCGVSKNDHFEMIKRVTNSAPFVNALNTIDNVEYYQAISKMKQLPTDNECKSSLYVWKLIGLILKSENLDIIKQYSQIFYNNLILLLKENESINLKINNQTFTEFSKIEQFLNTEFTKFDESESINNIIQIYTRLNSDIALPLIKQLYPNTDVILPYFYPLNIKIYGYLSDTRVLNLLKLAKNDLVEIPYMIDDVMNDETDLSEYFFDLVEEESVTKSLKHFRGLLNISESMDLLCFIDSIFRMEQNCQTDIELLLLCDRLLLCVLQYFIKHSNFKTYTKQELNLYNNIFTNMRHILGNSLMDFTSHYSIDHEIFSSHLKIFKYVYYIMLKNENNLTNLNTVFEYITKLSMKKQYERLRSTHVQSSEQSSQSGTINIVDENVLMDELVKLGKDLIEELSYQQSSFFSYLNDKCYYPNAFIYSLYLNFSNYLKDVQTVFSRFVKTELSGGVFEIFEIFESFLKLFNECLFNEDESNHDEEDTDTLNNMEKLRQEYPSKMLKLFEPIMAILRVPMNNWMNEIQNHFFKYLENAVRLEKFEPISQDVMYSSSYVDLFTFIRQGIPSLYRLCLPNSLEYFRHFNQCLSGLMQRYCVHMVSNLPKLEEFTPKKTQPFSSVSTNTGGNGMFKKLISSSDNTDNSNGLITPRYECSDISYESLFVRLANLVNTRRQYIKVVKELIEQSDNFRMLFIGKGNANNTNLPTVFQAIDFYSNLEGTSELLKDFIKQLTELIGCRNIYHELYNNLFGELYLPTVKDSTLTKMIQDYFEPCLESLVEMTDDPNCVEWIIVSMFKNLMKSLQFIIVDGYISQGNEFHLIKRQYGVNDVKILLSDLSLVEKFFYSDGEGISDWNFILQSTTYLKNVIANVMDKPSEHLINGSNQNPSFDALNSNNTTKTPFTKNAVYKVLFNRNDPIAKKFIKNHKYRYD